jgi:hypothetical protein
MSTNSPIRPDSATSDAACTPPVAPGAHDIPDFQAGGEGRRDVTGSVQRRATALQELNLEELLRHLSASSGEQGDQATLSAPLLIAVRIDESSPQTTDLGGTS